MSSQVNWFGNSLASAIAAPTHMGASSTRRGPGRALALRGPCCYLGPPPPSTQASSRTGTGLASTSICPYLPPPDLEAAVVPIFLRLARGGDQLPVADGGDPRGF